MRAQGSRIPSFASSSRKDIAISTKKEQPAAPQTLKTTGAGRSRLSAQDRFIDWFQSVAPYIHAFRGKVFVIAFGGEVVADGRFLHLTHDLNLLAALGVKLVLVHGSRPQIEAKLAAQKIRGRYSEKLRITDGAALEAAMEVAGKLRVQIEALLSMGLPNSPMAGAHIRVASGNFVTARPIGVVDGIDLMHTGEVRKIDALAIERRLKDDEMVVLSPLGYSPTGEVFNLSMGDVAAATAVALKAEKLIFLTESAGVVGRRGELLRELTVREAQGLLAKERVQSEEMQSYLPAAVRACDHGVGRAHLISGHLDDSLLLELFTHKGVGTLVTPDPLETLRHAKIDDIGGILQLLEPLEVEGILVKRNRDLLEMEIDRFWVLEHDRMIIGCAALYPFSDERSGELAGLAVHPEFRGRGAGERLMVAIEKRARNQRLKQLFVLTTRTEHWFVERGFVETDVSELPRKKKELYNYQRRSVVLIKKL